MQKFSEFVKQQNVIKEAASRDSIAQKYNEMYEAKLKEFGVKSPIELNEAQTAEFNEYLKTIKEELKNPKTSTSVKEAEIKDEKAFREYAIEVLKKAHGDDFDQDIADKVIDGIVSKVEDNDWGAAVGRLTSGLGK